MKRVTVAIYIPRDEWDKTPVEQQQRILDKLKQKGIPVEIPQRGKEDG